jgi:hypothetical protein
VTRVSLPLVVIVAAVTTFAAIGLFGAPAPAPAPSLAQAIVCAQGAVYIEWIADAAHVACLPITPSSRCIAYYDPLGQADVVKVLDER